jgi:hypothetical protein
MDTKPTFFKRFQNVQQKVATVTKKGTNTFHNYKYAFEADFIAVLKPLLGENGLFITETVVEAHNQEVITKQGNRENLVTVTVDYTIRDTESAEFITARAMGQGQDGTDKALPKALTMANKYFLAKMFQIETGDDAENDDRPPEKKTVLKIENPTSSKFDTAKMMIKQLNSIEELEKVNQRVVSSKNYDAKQKAELIEIISQKIYEIENPTS